MSSDGLRAAAALAGVGLPPSTDDLDPAARRAVALATELGAPLAGVLAGVVAREQEAAAAERAVRRATAQARAVAVVLVLAPPVLAPLLLRLAAPAGGASPAPAVLAVAGGLWLLGAVAVLLLVRGAARAAPPRPRPTAWWALAACALLAGQLLLALPLAVLAVRAQRRPVPVDPALAELVELAAIALRAGRGLGPALRLAGRQLPGSTTAAARLALWVELGARGEPPCLPQLARRLAPSLAHGAPALPVLDAHAAELRAEAQQRRLEAAERLGVQLTVPTALLLLPAALLVVLAPVVRAALAALP